MKNALSFVNFISAILASAFIVYFVFLLVASILLDCLLRRVLLAYCFFFLVLIAISPLAYIYISLIVIHALAIIYILYRDKKLPKVHVVHSAIIVMFTLFFVEQSQSLANIRAM